MKKKKKISEKSFEKNALNFKLLHRVGKFLKIINFLWRDFMQWVFLRDFFDRTQKRALKKKFTLLKKTGIIFWVKMISIV